MADFNIAYDLTNKAEGAEKLSLDPEDNGNWTGGKKNVGKLVGSKYGVSAPVLSNYLKRTATASDMANLKLVDAKAIAKMGYWDKVWGDKIESQEQANMVYDNAYNIGVVPAIKMVQLSLGAKETGKMDDLTLKLLNS